MDSPVAPSLAVWQNFYVIAGTSAGALTGLQFVVITLITQSRAPAGGREIRAFGTPTVVHFCMALLISMLIVAPWPAPRNLGFCLAACGVGGVLYTISTIWHAGKTKYRPDLEDWIWYSAIPLIAHFVLVIASASLVWDSKWPLIAIAGDTLLFLLLGVRNAWDTVTYIAITRAHDRSQADTE